MLQFFLKNEIHRSKERAINRLHFDTNYIRGNFNEQLSLRASARVAGRKWNTPDIRRTKSLGIDRSYTWRAIEQSKLQIVEQPARRNSFE